jgi:hypothetical protein
MMAYLAELGVMVLFSAPIHHPHLALTHYFPTRDFTLCGGSTAGSMDIVCFSMLSSQRPTRYKTARFRLQFKLHFLLSPNTSLS